MLKDLTGITPEVRRRVYERDEKDGRVCCIYCGRPSRGTYYLDGCRYEDGIDLAHVVGRAQMGKGIEKNLVSFCRQCHQMFDNGNNPEEQVEMRLFVVAYLQNHYDDWDYADLVVKKEDMYG